MLFSIIALKKDLDDRIIRCEPLVTERMTICMYIHPIVLPVCTIHPKMRHMHLVDMNQTPFSTSRTNTLFLLLVQLYDLSADQSVHSH